MSLIVRTRALAVYLNKQRDKYTKIRVTHIYMRARRSCPNIWLSTVF